MTQPTNQSQSRVCGPEQFSTGSVTSRDGTAIGFRRLGRGPGVVLLHGAMESAQSHMQLATALADAFTVYLPDRRGRGTSGPYREPYSVQKDIEDVDALLTATGALDVFGVSSGGIIMLHAALALPSIRRAAIYEPPLFTNSAAPRSLLTRFDREMAQGKLAAALVAGMRGAKMGPPIFNLMPRWLLELMTNKMLSREAQQGVSDYMSFGALAPTLHYDFQLVVEMSESLERFRGLQTPVLLLGGSKSPAYLKEALTTLQEVLPSARRVELPGLDHGGSSDVSDMNRNGQPQRVAQELRQLFA
jgi:pimeloyl-ACP methyl ester carboxylesterase